MVLSLARSTICSSTTLSSSRRRVHLACPFGAGPNASAINFAFENPGAGGVLVIFAGQHGFEHLFDQLAAGCEGCWRYWYPAPRRSGCRSRPSPASDTSAFNRILAFANNWAERLPLLIRSLSCWTSSVSSTAIVAGEECTFSIQSEAA